MVSVNRRLTSDESKNVLSKPDDNKPGPKSLIGITLRALSVGDGVELAFASIEERRKRVRAIRMWGTRNGYKLRVSYSNELVVWVVREK